MYIVDLMKFYILNPKIIQRLGPQIGSSLIGEYAQSLPINKVRKFADLRSSELIC